MFPIGGDLLIPTNMKRHLLLLSLTCLTFLSCADKQEKFIIGVSQCSADIWREKQNDELRVGAYMHDNVELRFASAYDSDERQIQQIDSLVAQGIDLLIVAPNQVATVSPAIDRTYDSGIPVIVFDRKTNSKKYTASASADNYEMGRVLGEHIASRLNNSGTIVEIKGLKDSSPAIERHNGFTDAVKQYPGLSIVGTAQGDWTEQSAYVSVKQMLSKMSQQTVDDIDYVFAQNDRMAMGGRKAFQEYKKEHPDSKQSLPLFSGIDGLSGKGGGIQLVRDTILDATYIYPTLGDQLLNLALNILEKKPYETENLYKATLVTSDNAEAILMTTEEADRQATYLDQLHEKVSEYMKLIDNQRLFNVLTLCALGLLLLTIVSVYLYFQQRARIHEEREHMTQDKLDFYTQISHQLRTPLTLLKGPVEELANSDLYANASDEGKALLDIVLRNTQQLKFLIDKVLDNATSENVNDIQPALEQMNINEAIPREDIIVDTLDYQESKRPTLLIVDDNDDIRLYLRSILQSHYDVFEAADGELGLEQAHLEVPDLIISDVMMPNMNGLEFCKRIKHDVATSHIPVILLTARAMNEHQVEGYESGADAYITKPFDKNVLLSRISNLLQSRKYLKLLFGQKTENWQETVDSTEQSDAELSNIEMRESTFINKLNEIIRDKMSISDLSVEDIGSDIGLSRVQLYRKVKALTGISPVELLRKQRLQRANTLLSTTDKTISEIAYEVGFTAPSYFTKCFKDEYGVLPGEARSK